MSRVVVPGDDQNADAIRQAVLLADKTAEEHGHNAVLLLIPGKDNLRGTTLAVAIGEAAAKDLVAGKVVTLPSGAAMRVLTERTAQRTPIRERVVVVVYAVKRLLDIVDGHRGFEHVVVIAGDAEAVNKWRATWDAATHGSASAATDELVDDAVVRAALRTLDGSVNKASGLAHPRDRDAAIWILRTLRDEGHTWDPEGLGMWARRSGWTPAGADDLADIAAKILDRRALRTSRPFPFRTDIYQRWRAEATED